jgi:hypothetical protein
MKYSILAAFSESIPYIPGLRELTGSSSSAILMMQLEYWFNRYPEGFYKFLETPQKNHPDYTPGDSWTEELAFGKEEFRSAFDRIGNRFSSKTQYEEAKRSGQEFSDKFYLSYFDRQTGLTYYHRCHDRINEFISQIEPRHKGVGKKARKTTTKPQSQNLDHVVDPNLREIVDPNLREIGISEMSISEDPIYRNGDSRFTDPYIYSETTPETTTEIKIKSPLTPQGEAVGKNFVDNSFEIQDAPEEDAIANPLPTQKTQNQPLVQTEIPPQRINVPAIENDSRFVASDPTAENMEARGAIAATGAMQGSSCIDPGFLEFYRLFLNGCDAYKKRGRECTTHHAKSSLGKLWRDDPLRILGEIENWQKSKATTAQYPDTQNIDEIPEDELDALLKAIEDKTPGVDS